MPIHHQPSSSTTPLWAVYAFTVLNSFCTSVVSNGISFVAHEGFRFSNLALYSLFLVLGLTYIVGARLAGPMLRGLEARFPALHRRTILLVLMVLMGLLAALPQLALVVSGKTGVPPAWTMWVLVVVYSPLSGVLWPVVEAFLSGGRSGKELRSAVGRWNVLWSLSGVACYWAMAPFLKNSPSLVLLGLTIVHFASAAALVAFPRNPGTHGEAGIDEDDAHPDRVLYIKLLATFRLLLPMAYVVSSALSPYLPGALESLGVAGRWAPPLASAWLIARVVTFAVLERWHGWHGRWATAVVGATFLLVGFAVCVLTPPFVPAEFGVGLRTGIMLSGLALFGVGMATVYTAALYYAMAVGKAEVDAGGTHEALIGLGYAAGPSTGLVAMGLVSAGAIDQRFFEPTMLGQVALAGVLVAGMVLLRVRRHAKPGES
jgi:hypothetical protein